MNCPSYTHRSPELFSVGRKAPSASPASIPQNAATPPGKDAGDAEAVSSPDHMPTGLAAIAAAAEHASPFSSELKVCLFTTCF